MTEKTKFILNVIFNDLTLKTPKAFLDFSFFFSYKDKIVVFGGIQIMYQRNVTGPLAKILIA